MSTRSSTRLHFCIATNYCDHMLQLKSLFKQYLIFSPFFCFVLFVCIPSSPKPPSAVISLFFEPSRRFGNFSFQPSSHAYLQTSLSVQSANWICSWLLINDGADLHKVDSFAYGRSPSPTHVWAPGTEPGEKGGNWHWREEQGGRKGRMEEEKVRRPPTKETRNSRWRKRRRQMGGGANNNNSRH